MVRVMVRVMIWAGRWDLVRVVWGSGLGKVGVRIGSKPKQYWGCTVDTDENTVSSVFTTDYSVVTSRVPIVQIVEHCHIFISARVLPVLLVTSCIHLTSCLSF